VASSNWSLQAARNGFSAVVAAALQGVPQTVTGRGGPAVVVVAADDYARLTRPVTGAAPSFAEHLLAFPQDGGTFEPTPIRPREVEF
jgi:prevent-host-death family protein